MFAILKQLADNEVAIYGSGVLEVLSDGFGFFARLNQTICPVLTIFMSRQVRYAGSAFALVTRLKVKFAHPKMASAILPVKS